MLIHVQAFVYLVLWFISQLYSGIIQWIGGVSVGGIAWWAHISGFLAGMFIHRVFVMRRRYRYY